MFCDLNILKYFIYSNSSLPLFLSLSLFHIRKRVFYLQSHSNLRSCDSSFIRTISCTNKEQQSWVKGVWFEISITIFRWIKTIWSGISYGIQMHFSAFSLWIYGNQIRSEDTVVNSHPQSRFILYYMLGDRICGMTESESAFLLSSPTRHEKAIRNAVESRSHESCGSRNWPTNWSRDAEQRDRIKRLTVGHIGNHTWRNRQKYNP